eukprot:TRINITY_DN6015_c0_g2_i2.p1 TRINITY_DN6015_c0_g2~~TRINITY_DN6015_c0_g2_i2.p1  ORF type:complete len:461 (+),score=41.31 TRINITY_DN6015_c0_g2_i2:110-1492(+)
MASFGKLLLFVAFVTTVLWNTKLASADVVLNFVNGTSISFNSVPIKFDGNVRDFPNVTAEFAGFGCDEPTSCVGRILWLPYRGWKHPYLETLLENLRKRFEPVAVLVYHETEDSFTGGFTEWVYNGVSSKEVTFPVVEIDPDAFAAIRQADTSIATITVTSHGISAWRDFKLSWWYPFFSVTSGLFSVAVIAIGIRSLFRIGLRRHMAVLCISIEMVACLCRVIFCLDPFSGWRILPTAFRQLFLSISWPMTLIASLLLTFFWSQLINLSSLEIRPIITRSKIPAVAASVILMVLELVSSSLRMASVSVSIVFTLNGAIYFLVCVACMIHYIYVSTKVLLFLRTLPKLNKKQNVLQRFTFRAMLSTLGYFGTICGTIMAITPFESIKPYGSTVMVYIILQCCNFIGLMTCLSFSGKGQDSTTKSISSKNNASRDSVVVSAKSLASGKSSGSVSNSSGGQV